MHTRTRRVLLPLALLPFLLGAADLLRNGSMEMDEDNNGVADGWSLSVHRGAEGTAELVAGSRPDTNRLLPRRAISMPCRRR
jgi:hypothetical protein